MEKEFKELLIKVEKYMHNKKFDSAIKYYHKLRTLFDELPPDLKLRYEKEALTTYRELILYITTNEAYCLAETHGQLKALGNHLEQIYDLEKDLAKLPDAETILNYVKPKFQFCLNIYEYRNCGKDFDDKFKQVEHLVAEGKTKAALKEYAHLLIAYNKYIRYENEDKAKKVYNKILDLFYRIKTHKQIEDAYKKPKFKQQTLPDKVPYNPTRPYVSRPSVRLITDNLKPFPQREIFVRRPIFKVTQRSAEAFNFLFKDPAKLRLNYDNLKPYPLSVSSIQLEDPFNDFTMFKEQIQNASNLEEEPIDDFAMLKEHIKRDNVLEALNLLKRL